MRHSEVARVGMERSLHNETLLHLGAEWHVTQEGPRTLERIQRRIGLRDLEKGLKLTTLSSALGMGQGPSIGLVMEQEKGSTSVTSLSPVESRVLEWDLRECDTNAPFLLHSHIQQVSAVYYKPAAVLALEINGDQKRSQDHLLFWRSQSSKAKIHLLQMLRNRYVHTVKGQTGGCDPVEKVPEGFLEEVILHWDCMQEPVKKKREMLSANGMAPERLRVDWSQFPSILTARRSKQGLREWRLEGEEDKMRLIFREGSNLLRRKEWLVQEPATLPDLDNTTTEGGHSSQPASLRLRLPGSERSILPRGPALASAENFRRCGRLHGSLL